MPIENGPQKRLFDAKFDPEEGYFRDEGTGNIVDKNTGEVWDPKGERIIGTYDEAAAVRLIKAKRSHPGLNRKDLKTVIDDLKRNEELKN